MVVNPKRAVEILMLSVTLLLF